MPCPEWHRPCSTGPMRPPDKALPSSGDRSEILGRKTLWTLSRQGAESIRAVVVAFTDGAELEVKVGNTLRSQSRFILDAGAVIYADRLRRGLESIGYRAQRQSRQTSNVDS